MSPSRTNPVSCLLTLRGRGVSSGLACGLLRRNRESLAPEAMVGAILVLGRTRPADLERILACAGTVTFDRAPLSHAALLSRELGKPSVDLSAVADLRPPDDSRTDAPMIRCGLPDGGGLAEGDAVVLDGVAGELRAHLGPDPSARRELRQLYELLRPGENGPNVVEQVAARIADSRAPAAAAGFVIEAAVLAGRLAAAEACDLMTGLADSSVGAEIREQRRRIAARNVEQFGGWREEMLEAIRGGEDSAGLDSLLELLRRRAARERRVMAALGTELPSVLGSPDGAERAAAIRREQLRDAIRVELRRVSAIDDDLLERRLGSLSRLAEEGHALGLTDSNLDSLDDRVRRLGRRRAESVGTEWIVPLHPGTAPSIDQVGGKALGLFEAARILGADCRIPRGFVLTTAAYRRHLLGPVEERIRDLIETGATGRDLSRRSRAAILGAPVPPEVVESLVQAIGDLPGTRWAVRSSASFEDSPAGSLAGMLDSELGLAARADSVAAARRVWASMWNGRALALLDRMGADPLEAAVAVIVQEMVATRAAGVLTTRDPTGRPETILVSAVAGLAEGVTGGGFRSDLYRIERASGAVLLAEPGGADRRIEPDPDGAGTIEVPRAAAERGRPCLDARDLASLHRLARRFDPTGRSAVEIEFGFDPEGTPCVFQLRRPAVNPNETLG